MILIFDEKIYVLNKDIKITDFNNLEKNIWEWFKNHSFLDNFLGKWKFFRKIFFETEEKISLLENNIKNLKKFSENINFWEQNFSNFSTNIKTINIYIKKKIL